MTPNAAVIPIFPSMPVSTRLPPFGREVVDVLRAGKRVNVYVYAGRDAWNRARTRRRRHGAGYAMLLPLLANPNAFVWPVVPTGVLVLAPDRSTALETARAVVSCGTPMVFAVFGHNEALIIRLPAWRTGA